MGAEKINRRVLEALIKSGSMDEFKMTRKLLTIKLADAIKGADQSARDSAAGQGDMFGIVDSAVEEIL